MYIWVYVAISEHTRGYKVLRLLYGGRGMWVKEPVLPTSDSIREYREATHTASFHRTEFPPSTKSGLVSSLHDFSRQYTV